MNSKEWFYRSLFEPPPYFFVSFRMDSNRLLATRWEARSSFARFVAEKASNMVVLVSSFAGKQAAPEAGTRGIVP